MFIIDTFRNAKTKIIIHNSKRRYFIWPTSLIIGFSVLVLWLCNSILTKLTCHKQLHEIQGCVMTQAVTRKSVTSKVRLLSQPMPCRNSVAQFNTQRGYYEHFISQIRIIPPISQIKYSFTFPENHKIFTKTLNKTNLSFSIQKLATCSFMCGQ